MGASPSRSRTIVLSTPVSAAVRLESQQTWAVPEARPAYAAWEERLAYAGLALEEPQTDAAKLTQTEADPSRPGREASSAGGLAIPTPKLGSPGDFLRRAAAPDRLEQGWR
jgi:hypothetical protein